jgi:hypothetical protein
MTAAGMVGLQKENAETAMGCTFMLVEAPIPPERVRLTNLCRTCFRHHRRWAHVQLRARVIGIRNVTNAREILSYLQVYSII